jgi:hypothetical protein
MRLQSGCAARTVPVASRHSDMLAHHLPNAACPTCALPLVVEQHGARGGHCCFRSAQFHVHALCNHRRHHVNSKK